MEIFYLGHAGVMLKHHQVQVLFDPFLSGEFYWRGVLNHYTGPSPWIGSQERIDQFVDTYAESTNAILISHAHMDHFDPATIVALMHKNPDIEIYAPRPIVDWLKASSILDNNITNFLAPVEWDGVYEIENEDDESGQSILKIETVPNSKIEKEPFPYRVGYLVSTISSDENAIGVLLPGDSHSVGEWDRFLGRVTHAATWGAALKHGLVEYFLQGQNFEEVMLIHWEGFTPGNFDCNQDPKDYLPEIDALGVRAKTLPHNQWVSITRNS